MKGNPGQDAPIGVFDSGIGGLTVVRALRRHLPGESIVYLGDNARTPYGTKSAETITRFALEDARFLVERGVKLIVVACHSASSTALPELVRHLSVPVLGVIRPGARALVAATRSRRVAVIGTSATIRSAAYERAVRELAPDVEIVAKATPLFVPLAEEGWVDGEVAEAAARRYLSGLAEERIDAVLLGCTHFPLLAGVIGATLGPGVRIIDSSEETAAAAETTLREAGLLAEGGQARQRCYLTDLTPNFETVGARFLGEPLGDVVRASLGEKG
jgi:glutamate racemase